MNNQQQDTQSVFAGLAVAIILLVVLFILAVARGASADDSDVGLWLARSCVGEGGWESARSGECAAILHVYRKRAELSGRSVLTVAKKYSAAIKRRKNRPNPWVLHLNREGTQPEHWPSKKSKWEKHTSMWTEVLELADSFLLGDVQDPVPDADHYGCKVDHRRAMRAGWWKIKTKFRNNFYSIKQFKPL